MPCRHAGASFSAGLTVDGWPGLDACTCPPPPQCRHHIIARSARGIDHPLNYFLIDRGPNSAMGSKVEGFRGERPGLCRVREGGCGELLQTHAGLTARLKHCATQLCDAGQAMQL